MTEERRVEDVQLRRPEDLRGPPPTVSLCMLVKNGESVLPRLLERVGPHVDELVVVLNDTTDGSARVLREASDCYDLDLVVVEVTSRTHPQLYQLDVAETYQVGEPLCEEVFAGPFTGRPVLADWAAARNLGWGRATREWRLFLDADDQVDDPEVLPALCVALGERGVDAATSRYYFDGKRSSMRERLARNVPHITWEGKVHEHLVGARRTAHVDGSLVVRDLRDSRGDGLRPPARDFKILYRRARELGWRVPARELLYMGWECRKWDLSLSAALLRRCYATSGWAEERAWAQSLLGECHESVVEPVLAAECYERALAEFPSGGAAFRLSRARHFLKDWEGVVEAYRIGVEHRLLHPQLLDGGEELEESCRLYVAGALRELGHLDEALVAIKKAEEALPGRLQVVEMRKVLEAEVAAGRRLDQGGSP